MILFAGILIGALLLSSLVLTVFWLYVDKQKKKEEQRRMNEYMRRKRK